MPGGVPTGRRPGRPAKALAVRALEGTLRVAPPAPLPVRDVPPPPKGLGREGRALWRHYGRCASDRMRPESLPTWWLLCRLRDRLEDPALTAREELAVARQMLAFQVELHLTEDSIVRQALHAGGGRGGGSDLLTGGG